MVSNRMIYGIAMFQTLMLVSLVVATTSAGVTPGDEDSICEQLRSVGVAPTPAYSANMRVLMDSWNYQNLLPPRIGAVWDQVDNDRNNPSGVTANWIQQSNTPCEQAVQVCGFSAGPQDNWLITQLINRTVNGTLRLPQVIVTIEFEQRARGCNTTMTMNCQRAFNTYIYESSIESSTGAARNVNDYEQVLSVSSADHTSGNRVSKKTITINFATNHSSFYFAIQDESSCTVVTRLIVSYTVCPAQTSNLISYPEIVSPSGLYDGLPSNISVSAMCIENAQPENGVAPVVTCSAEGVWAGTPWPGLGCRCVLGYFIEIFNDSETCNPCPVGMYLSPSNNSCSTCPANSVSEQEGLGQCTCIEGYYRVSQGEEDLPCTRNTYQEPISMIGEINSTDSNGPQLEMDESEQNHVLLAAALPLVLFCVVSLTASVMFAVLLYIIRAKKKANAAVPMKSNHDDRERATKEIEEVYYDTIDLNASVDPQILNMEKNCAYGEIHMQNT